MAFSFNNLNLEGVAVSAAGEMLKPGRYHCEVKKAEVKPTRTGGTQIELTFSDLGGNGAIRAYLNVHVPSSQEATRIGREQLKSMLVFGGHPNPDHPGDIRTLVGLKPGVAVAAEDYEKDGEKRKGSKVRGFFDPSELGGDAGAAANSSPKVPAPPGFGLDDDIPF